MSVPSPALVYAIKNGHRDTGGIHCVRGGSLMDVLSNCKFFKMLGKNAGCMIITDETGKWLPSNYPSELVTAEDINGVNITVFFSATPQPIYPPRPQVGHEYQTVFVELDDPAASLRSRCPRHIRKLVVLMRLNCPIRESLREDGRFSQAVLDGEWTHLKGTAGGIIPVDQPGKLLLPNKTYLVKTKEPFGFRHQ